MGVVSLSAAATTATAAAAAASIQFQSQQPSPPPLLLLRVRGVFPATTRGGGGGGGGGGGAFSISTTRTQICFPKQRLLFFQVKSVESSNVVDELQDSKVVPSNVLATQKEEQEQHISAASPTNLTLESKKLKAIARVAEIGTDGQLPPNTLYLIDIGLDLDQIKQMARKWPSISYPGWGRKIKPLVGFLLDIGVPPSSIPKILYKLPQLGGMRLSEKLIPYMAYLETLGLDKSKWAKVIDSCPSLLTHSRQKLEATTDYLCELGLPRDRIGKVLIRFPQIMNLSIDGNLRPTAEYFQPMGVNITSLLSHHPSVFGQSIECKLKPVTEFFVNKGYSIDEIGTMASGYGCIYSLSLTKNLIPKWDFFLTMNYPRSDLVKYPYYFGYSLEGRIKPRYAQMKECGVKLCLSKLLTPSDSEFEKILNRSMKGLLPSTIPFM